jgi:hypothetical protein
VEPLRENAPHIMAIEPEVLAYRSSNFIPVEADWRLFEQVYYFRRYEKDFFEKNTFEEHRNSLKKGRILQSTE